VGPRAVLDTVVKRKIPNPRRESKYIVTVNVQNRKSLAFIGFSGRMLPTTVSSLPGILLLVLGLFNDAVLTV
jgi:hypothetical protein